MKKIGKKGWIGIGVVAVLIIAFFLLRGGKKEEKVSFDTAKVENRNIQTSITATGTIEPVTSVTVGTQVSGIVSKLYVDYNSVVKKGQVIAELDRTNLISELNTAKANLSSAQSSAAYELSNFNRYKTLYDKGLVSADEFESAQLSYLKAKEELSLSSVIAQPCSSVVNFCERYMPELLPSLAPIQSPLICMAIYLRLEKQLEGKIAFLSPCIAKTDEIGDQNTGKLVSYNITFDKLKRKLAEMHVQLDQYPETGFDGMQPGIGHVYSRPGGLGETIRVTNKDLWIRQIDSVRRVYPYLKEYYQRQTKQLPVPDIVDILNCTGGCNCGTGTEQKISMDDIDYKTNIYKSYYMIWHRLYSFSYDTRQEICLPLPYQISQYFCLRKAIVSRQGLCHLLILFSFLH